MAQQSEGTHFPLVWMAVMILSFFQPERECFSPNVLAVLYYPGLNMTDLPPACCTSSILMCEPVSSSPRTFPSGPSYPHSPALRESQEMFGTCPETPASPHRAASAGNVGFQAMLVNAVIPQRDTPGNGSEMRKETVKQEWKSRERKQFYHCQKKTPRIGLGELNNLVARRALFLRRKSICFDHAPPIGR